MVFIKRVISRLPGGPAKLCTSIPHWRHKRLSAPFAQKVTMAPPGSKVA
jgi:hypothetical protein